MSLPIDSTPICAISTPPGVGGIAVARISGAGAIETVDKIWRGAPLSRAASHTAHYGEIFDTTAGEVLDAGVATLFRGPGSYTGEDTVELSIHGSRYVQSRLISLLVENGCRSAGAGEFTRRAFVNGRLDLASAEAVADMIASESKAAHSIAVRQMKGDYSRRLEALRSRLIDLAALLELELDFSEEDVEFASRSTLIATATEVRSTLSTLASSFKAGAAIKAGVPVAIVGTPNAGKSTLLNSLLSEERALVSPISGTTRDTIEETLDIDGIRFRLIDTAGLRPTDDTIEQLGIERALSKISTASIVIWLIDPTQAKQAEDEVKANISPDATLIKVVNKSDIFTYPDIDHTDALRISAKKGTGLDTLRSALTQAARAGLPDETDMVVTNARHYESIIAAAAAIDSVLAALTPSPRPESGSAGSFADEFKDGNTNQADYTTGVAGQDKNIGLADYTTGVAGQDMNIGMADYMTGVAGQDKNIGLADYTTGVTGQDMNIGLADYMTGGAGQDIIISGELIAQDLRQAIHHLGAITGAITTTDILSTIFSRFCIGK